MADAGNGCGFWRGLLLARGPLGKAGKMMKWAGSAWRGQGRCGWPRGARRAISQEKSTVAHGQQLQEFQVGITYIEGGGAAAGDN